MKYRTLGKDLTAIQNRYSMMARWYEPLFSAAQIYQKNKSKGETYEFKKKKKFLFIVAVLLRQRAR